MALSAPMHANFSYQQSKFCFLRLDRMHKRLAIKAPCKSRSHSVWIIKSVMHNRKSSINNSGSTEPARILLERLFDQTQKLEEQIGRDFNLPRDVKLGRNLEKLESDLVAALSALKKKEEDLEEAEKKVFLEYSELNQAKKELVRREKKISTACSKQEKLEEELKHANLNLASRATEIEELKLKLKERDQQISIAQSALSLKEDEVNEMINELMKKSEEAANTESELRSKAQLLDNANGIIKKQELELKELRNTIQEREKELEVALMMRKVDEEKLEVSESNLEKQTTDWLLAQEELKKLAEEASKHTDKANETMEDFRRAKKLLANMRSELVSSQKSLASSRNKMKDQQQLLEKQFIELEEQKKSITSYMKSLKDAHLEVEREKGKLKVSVARSKALERDLLLEKELTDELKRDLNKENSSLHEAIVEMCLLREELKRRENEFREANDLLEVKEKELVEARLEIQNLKSEQASLRSILEERDLELLNARKMLEEANQEISELRVLMNNRENQLSQATAMLKEREKHVQIIHHELNDTKLKFSEAENVVECILELTNKLVGPTKDKYMGESHLDTWLKTEIEITREDLRSKEMDVLASERALVMKEEELKRAMRKLEERESELKKMKEELIRDGDDLRKLYAMTQERIGDKSVEELGIEKLQLEAAQLEIEAAMSALQKITEMSRELLLKSSFSIEADYDVNALSSHLSEFGIGGAHNECFGEISTEVARLSALTDQLVKEAGIVDGAH